MEQAQAKFEGFAVVELMGHQREIGFVTTEVYGQAVMFRIDTPELDDREYVLESPEYIDGRLAPKGTTVKRKAVEARSRLVSPGALYAINPCTEEAARAAIERTTHRPLMLVSLPEGAKLGPAVDGDIVDTGEPEDWDE